MSKPELQWSDEEKKIYKDYEKKAKDLSEEQDKYKKVFHASTHGPINLLSELLAPATSMRHFIYVSISSQTLESEMKKMQASILESTQGFDEVLAKLFERKLKSETVIYQVR